MSNTTNLEVAQTILSQLGGTRRLNLMTGAKNFVGRADGVTFKVGRNGKKVTHVEITLRADDTYDVRFLWVRGTNVIERHKTEGAYNDMLRPLFEAQTGMYLSF